MNDLLTIILLGMLVVFSFVSGYATCWIVYNRKASRELGSAQTLKIFR
jgi:hypothetical protein